MPDSQKEMISFSLSDGASQTRAGLHATAPTKVVMRIMSEDNASPSNKKYVRTVATASAQVTGSDNSTFSTISFGSSSFISATRLTLSSRFELIILSYSKNPLYVSQYSLYFIVF